MNKLRFNTLLIVISILIFINLTTYLIYKNNNWEFKIYKKYTKEKNGIQEQKKRTTNKTQNK